MSILQFWLFIFICLNYNVAFKAKENAQRIRVVCQTVLYSWATLLENPGKKITSKQWSFEKQRIANLFGALYFLMYFEKFNRWITDHIFWHLKKKRKEKKGIGI